MLRPYPKNFHMYLILAGQVSLSSHDKSSSIDKIKMEVRTYVTTYDENSFQEVLLWSSKKGKKSPKSKQLPSQVLEYT